MQWEFPSGTSIEGNGYLIIWADEDDTQSGLHANFKISASGESLFLADTSGTIIDEVSFAAQTADISYGRLPNGTGAFQTMSPTFNAENTGATNTLELAEESLVLKAYPNPADQTFYLEISGNMNKEKQFSVFNLNGAIFYQDTIFDKTQIDVSGWASGMYIVRVDNAFLKIVVN